MTGEERKQKDKVAALTAIGLRPNTFRWNIQDAVLTKQELLKEVGEETKTGESIIRLAQEIVGESPKECSDQQGKIMMCLLCGRELLILKIGGGAMTCCGQNMEIKAPKRIP